MRKRRARAGFRLAVAGAVVVPAAVLCAVPASADPVLLPYQCQDQPPEGPARNGVLPVGVDAQAPASVRPFGTFVQKVIPQPQQIPPQTADGSKVVDMRDLDVRVAVPKNALLDFAWLSGGANLGPGKVTLRSDGHTLTVHIPGPLPGGVVATFPTVNLLVTAGASGTVDTVLGGTGYTDPGFSFTAQEQPATGPVVAIPTQCFPPAELATLATTKVEPVRGHR